MRTLYLLIIFISTVTINASGQSDYVPKYSVALNEESGKTLLNQCSRSTPENIKDFWEVSPSDVKIMEENFKKLKFIKSTDCCYSKIKIDSPTDYGYQYIGVTIKNRKYIYLNAFYVKQRDMAKWYKDWRTKPLVFCDGGEYFFGVLFDLDRKKFKELSVNGII